MAETRPQGPQQVGRLVTDADRAACADLLSDAYGSGQLTREEFDHRVGRALDARTDLDLQLLATGLVGTDQPDTPPKRHTIVSLSALDVVLALGVLATLLVLSTVVARYAAASDPGWVFVFAFAAASAALGAFIAGNRRRKP